MAAGADVTGGHAPEPHLGLLGSASWAPKVNAQTRTLVLCSSHIWIFCAHVYIYIERERARERHTYVKILR